MGWMAASLWVKPTHKSLNGAAVKGFTVCGVKVGELDGLQSDPVPCLDLECPL